MQICSRTHTHPNPKIPWQQWACAVCTPDLYDDVTIQGPEPDGKRQCPVCLNTAIYRDGRFRNHFDDGPSDRCRGSELCEDMAHALLNAMYRKLSVDEMLQAFVVRPGKTRDRYKTQARTLTSDLTSIIDELAHARRATGVLGVSVAAKLGITKPVFSSWETKIRSCSLSILLRWASILGYDVVLTSEYGQVRSDFLVRLRNARKSKCLSLEDVEAATGLTGSVVSSWERRERNPSANDFSTLAQFLGYNLAIVPRMK